MENASTRHQTHLTRLFTAARRASANGVVAQTEKVRLRYWIHWAYFCHDVCHVDPLLHDVTNCQSRIDLLTAFAAYVRQGNAGRGHQVRIGSVQDALCAIGKTFELDH